MSKSRSSKVTTRRSSVNLCETYQELCSVNLENSPQLSRLKHDLEDLIIFSEPRLEPTVLMAHLEYRVYSNGADSTNSLALCRIPNCDQAAVVDGMCVDCYTEGRARKEYLWKQSDPAYAARAKMSAERLRNYAWFVLFLALMTAIGYYVWPYVWAIFELWFGGDN